MLRFPHGGVPAPNDPDKPTEVELVMEEHKGDLSPTVTPSPVRPAPPPPRDVQTPSAKPSPAVPTQAAAPPTQAPAGVQADASEQSTIPAATSNPAPAMPEGPVQKAVREAPPIPKAPDIPVEQTEREASHTPNPADTHAEREPPAPEQAPKISLQGTDSPSDARAWGNRILPAAPDAVFHNRPPEYPRQAELNGEHGTVTVLIHISPAGTAVGVDVTRSSGYVLLDSAAREAVMRWRFLPAVKDGQPVASDMAIGFVFDY
jgi:protein TonB